MEFTGPRWVYCDETTTATLKLGIYIMGLTFHDEAIGRNLPGYRDKCIPQMLGGDYHGDVRHVNKSIRQGALVDKHGTAGLKI
uniref:Uncharacterized protein n=1 Tax=Pristionchus pacificus TaxID=54126 RepID=A0A2A6CMH7_PRIPA|eukprot:PDM79263.1 hypothetical protein PRIPAC_31842 [Pristionchus pacificus]